MRFDFMTRRWMESATNSELRAALDELEAALNEFESPTSEYMRIFDLHDEIVETVNRRFPVRLPRREHGWYLPNDD